MGMNHFGEISYLTRIGMPTVALVNNATSAHLGGLGSVEGIAKAKGEIFEGLAENGVAVINADDTFAAYWKSLVAQHKILTFGLQTAADVTASYTLHAEQTDISLSTPLGDASIKLPVAGKHNVSNALAAVTVAIAMGASLANIVTGLENFGGVKGRLQHKKGIKGAVVIDVGITRVEDASSSKGYTIKGDVAFDEVAPKCSFITPVPGGVGAMTIVGLLSNTMKAYKSSNI
jgi:UDP-N-acetylmuramoyl-tripeptide--D-alanyl-D-alanine ligase